MLHSLENVYFNLDINNYEINDLIGASGYSNVFKAVDKRTGKEYAFKFTSLLDNDVSDSIFALDIMRICNFPTVLKNYGYFYFKRIIDIPDFLREKFISYKHQESNFYIIVNEYMPNGNLYDYIHCMKKKNIQIDSLFRYKIIFGIASTMKKLHSIHLFHRDLKPSHVFLDENFEPKISLCHTSKFLLSENEVQTQMIGTPMFIAPEIIYGNYYGLKADVYSFSIIILNMFTYNIELDDGSRLSSYNIYTKISNGKRFKLPKSIPVNYLSLIEKCWSQNEKDRPKFDEIIAFLKNDVFSIFNKKSDIDNIFEFQDKYEYKVDDNYEIRKLLTK